jgi:hypothetical protein
MENKKKRGKAGAFALLLCLGLLLASCGRGYATATEYFEKIAKAEALLPYGAWYFENKAPWEEGYLDESLEKAFFGERKIKPESLRLFLSSEEKPFELAFITCYTYKEADSVAALLSARLSFLQKSAKESGGASLDGGFVLLRGRTVLYVAAASADKIRSALGV